MNTAATNKVTLCTVKLHSVIDIITNSSTEIFCVVEGSGEEAVKDVVNGILEQLGCEICSSDFGLSVSPHIEYEEGTYDEKEIEGQFDISYEYGAKPCKIIRKKIEEMLTVVKFTEED
jgi:hypothetical protein